MPRLPFEWQQTDQEVVVSLLVKNVNPDKVELDVQKRECHVTITLATGADSMFILDPLFHPVDPERSRHQVLPSRINVYLAKALHGQRWAYLDDGNQPEHVDSVVEPPPVIEQIPIQIMSDLHLELFFPRREGIGVHPGYHVFDCAPSARFLALVGDTGLAAHGGLYDFLERTLHKYRHIFYVIGNHEGYSSSYEHTRAELHDFASRMRANRLSDPTLGTFVLLDRTRFDLSDQVTILGCTLWSHIPPSAALVVRQSLRDFQVIKDWTIDTYNQAHVQDIQWLMDECAEIRASEPQRRVIVLTHHAPTKIGTSSPQHEDSPFNSAFSTELSSHPVWAAPISTWVYGHTHHNSDKILNGIRILSNQRGYEGVEANNAGFNPNFVVRV